MLSDEVKLLEEKVRQLKQAVQQTKYVVKQFVDAYDNPNYKNLMPVNRCYHTKPLKDLLKFIR